MAKILAIATIDTSSSLVIKATTQSSKKSNIGGILQEFFNREKTGSNEEFEADATQLLGRIPAAKISKLSQFR